MAQNKLHVLIIGAGATGLLIAQGLKKEGIVCTIFDKEPSASHYRAREWGMSIQWGLPLLKDCLPPALFERLVTVAVDPHYQPEDPGRLPTLNVQTGELIKNIPLVFMYRVSRRRFRALLTEGLDVQYGKQLKAVRYGDDSSVTAAFEDGTEATGSLIIGADGGQSVVRTEVFGLEEAKATAMPYTVLNICVSFNDAEKALHARSVHPIMCHGIHPNGTWCFQSTQEVPDPNEPKDWSFQLMSTWPKQPGDVPVTLADMRKRAESFGEPFRSAWLWVPEDTVMSESVMSSWEPQPWDSKGGRVALAGDAAHLMTFQRGQGMNHGIADASRLTKLLKAVSEGTYTLEEAITDYQTEMVDRAGEEVRLSRKNTEMLHDWSRVKNSPLLSREAAYNREMARD